MDIFNDTTHVEHGNGFHDTEDPAELLRTLASYDAAISSHDAGASVSSSNNISNDHFASLLRAAATAGEVVSQADHSPGGGLGRTRGDSTTSVSDEFFRRTFDSENTQSRTKRKRAVVEDEDEDDGQIYGFIKTPKRQRKVRREDAEQAARVQEIWGPEDEVGLAATTEDVQHEPITTAEARATGVHSAAALFRRPSAASRKYTRPPMSKMFTSTELSPESFLHLQAAAKSFMLDEDHPDRFDCVGNRGREDSDMNKLKLFAHVKTFLEDEGWGERCFGETSLGGATRKLKWPAMKNKVISIVTPLLRRMVTNERQRRYAAETRKDKAKVLQVENPLQLVRDKALAVQINESPRPVPARGRSPSPSPLFEEEIDPKLNEYHYVVETPYPSADGDGTPTPQNGPAPVAQLPAAEKDERSVTYHVNLMKHGRRVKPKFTLTPSTCPGFASLVQHIHSSLDDDGQKPETIKVLCPDGLVDVPNEHQWREAVELVKNCEWMDGEVKFVVHVE